MPRVDHEFISCVPIKEEFAIHVCREFEQTCELITRSLLVYMFPVIMQGLSILNLLIIIFSIG